MDNPRAFEARSPRRRETDAKNLAEGEGSDKPRHLALRISQQSISSSSSVWALYEELRSPESERARRSAYVPVRRRRSHQRQTRANLFSPRGRRHDRRSDRHVHIAIEDNRRSPSG